jgi:glycosyltransferase involved in cell wall biosynthesis
MKLLHVMPRFGPGGGIVAIVRETSQWLIRQGFTVEVFAGPTDDPTRGGASSVPDPLPVRRFPYGRSQRLRFPLMVGLTEALTRSGADVIHAHNHRTGHVLQAAHVARRCGIPLVVSTYYHPALRTEPLLKKGAIRLMDFGFGLGAYGRAGALIALSKFEVDRLRPFALSAPIHVVPPGIDLSSWSDPAADHHDPRLPPEYFVYSGRIAGNKGIVGLVQALARLPPEQRRPLVVVGPETHAGARAQVEAAAQELGVRDLVVFLGYVDTPTYRGVLRGAKGLVLPSEWESFGIVLLDAMAARTPVIASRTGAVPEVLEEGRAGRLVPVGDPRALAEALASIDADRGETRRLVDRAAERVRAFDWSVTTESLRTIYEQLARA